MEINPSSYSFITKTKNKKTKIFIILTASIATSLAPGFAFGSLILLAPTPSKAEGGCPSGFYPAGGGYCRNIECFVGAVIAFAGKRDISAEETIKKYNKSCADNSGYQMLPVWGKTIIPQR